jgi:molybdopterin-binding protein
MKISARNVLKGKVKKVIHGAVNSEVTLELPGGLEVVSIITKTRRKISAWPRERKSMPS